MNYYVVVSQTKHPDYPIVSGYKVEAPIQIDAERIAKELFCIDTGYLLHETKINHTTTIKK